MAAPIPLDAPVTTATLPVSLFMAEFILDSDFRLRSTKPKSRRYFIVSDYELWTIRQVRVGLFS